MKKKDKYKIINYAVNDFNETFGTNVTRHKYSKKYIDELFKKYKYWSMVEASYCCYGWKNDCWQDIVQEGVWNFTIDSARKYIKDTIIDKRKLLLKCNRLYIEEKEGLIDILITLRDTEHKQDLRIYASNIATN